MESASLMALSIKTEKKTRPRKSKKATKIPTILSQEKTSQAKSQIKPAKTQEEKSSDDEEFENLLGTSKEIEQDVDFLERKRKLETMILESGKEGQDIYDPTQPF